MWQPRLASRMLAKIAEAQEKDGEGDDPQLRALFLVAHPDDETLGASAALGRLLGSTVVYLTDGAPRDERFRSPQVSGSRDYYACVRAEEAASALALVGLTAERIRFLGCVDQESIYTTGQLVEKFAQIVREVQPVAIITHPYEGGHPDHDAATLLAYLATRWLKQRDAVAIGVLEMTSYHAANGRRVSGEFLAAAHSQSSTGQDSLTLRLSAEERARKARMLGCYVSQGHVLSEFPLEPERLRLAPIYDFSRAPHEGQLWYEGLGWPLTGARWRQIAAQALAQFGEPACR